METLHPFCYGSTTNHNINVVLVQISPLNKRSWQGQRSPSSGSPTRRRSSMPRDCTICRKLEEIHVEAMGKKSGACFAKVWKLFL